MLDARCSVADGRRTNHATPKPRNDIIIFDVAIGVDVEMRWMAKCVWWKGMHDMKIALENEFAPWHMTGGLEIINKGCY
jgi:hypothetical protein